MYGDSVSRLRLLLALGAAALALVVGVLVATAGGTASATGPFQVLGSFDAAGNPEPSVFSYPDGAGRAIHWSMCATPGMRDCIAIASTDGTAHPGPQPAGTVFKFRATFQGKAYFSSLTWRGALHSATRPLLSGRAHFGVAVAGRAGTWAGGWGTETDQLGIEACSTARATGCVMLSGDELQCPYGHGCGSLGGVVGPLKRPNRARVGNWYTGWYLFALDAHLANTISGLVGYRSQAAISPWPLNATVVRSKPVGPVIGPPPPRVRFFPQARVRPNLVVVASVRCAVKCHVWLTLSRTGKHFTSGERLDWSSDEVINGSATIGVLGAIPTGHFVVTITVGDGPYLQGHTLVR